ncbi:dynein beta chain, ciliary-like [Ischnura elegans]|uniref:dynein beta chain, ciliary-like n=1 Tax=Ischnura elegans TaxID=197161 RepID=UPI001ED8764F|nr:dynein beta chain, ciliary-like [Ischnura elegans]
MASGHDKDEKEEEDPRLVFFFDYIQKNMKVKSDKWFKMIGNEENMGIINSFLDSSDVMVLTIHLNVGGLLIPSLNFPTSALKYKGVYFVKKYGAPIPKDNVRGGLIFGDMAPNPIDELATLVNEVFVPVLSNVNNHKGWPAVVSEDVRKHVHHLSSLVYQVRGQMQGQTLLPMPVGINRVEEAEKLLIQSEGEELDISLKSSLEGSVIKWCSQINEILKEDSASAFDNGANPFPTKELSFWDSRVKNLECIYQQLIDPRVKKMASILEISDSTYYRSFRLLFQNVVAALIEARDISIYLNTLRDKISNFIDSELPDTMPLLIPLMHTVCLVWANSNYYCSSSRIVLLMRQICNMLIEKAREFLVPESIFLGEADETLARVNQSMEMLNEFRNAFNECKDNLASYFKEKEPLLWNFNPKLIFDRMIKFQERLEVFKTFFETILEFQKLEKVEIGGLRGRVLGIKVVDIFEEFNNLLAEYGNKTYDALEPESSEFDKDYSSFQETIADFDRRLASIFSQAYDDCHNLESIFKLIYIAGSLADRPIIYQEVTPKHSRLIKLLNEEVDVVKEIFDDQIANYRLTGEMPIDINMPPVAGHLLWAHKLRQRIEQPFEAFKELEHPVVESYDAEHVLSKYDEMIACIEKFVAEEFKEWCAKVPDHCNRNLDSQLFVIKENLELELNFHPEVGLHFLFDFFYVLLLLFLEAVLREVRYMNLLEISNIPPEALDLFSRLEALRMCVFNLNETISRYNQIRATCTDLEFDLIEYEMSGIDELIGYSQENYNWNSEGLYNCLKLSNVSSRISEWLSWLRKLENFVDKLEDLVVELSDRVQTAQSNVSLMESLMEPWAKKPLFTRKDEKKDALLAIENREEEVHKRYEEVINVGVRIHELLRNNFQLLVIGGLRKKRRDEEEREAEEEAMNVDEGEIEDDDMSEVTPKTKKEKGRGPVKRKDEDSPGEESPSARSPKSRKIDKSGEGKSSDQGLKRTSPGTTKAAKSPLKDEETGEAATGAAKKVEAKAEAHDEKKAEPEATSKAPKKDASAEEDRKGSVKRGESSLDVISKEDIESKEMEEDVTPEPEFILDEETTEKWERYVEFIDSVVSDGLLQAILSSLSYITEEMRPGRSPLFEAQFLLVEPLVLFKPSMDLEDPDGFYALVESIIGNIVEASTLIPRISQADPERTHYLDDAESNLMTTEFRADILMRTSEVTKEALQFSTTFDNYAYLWLDDRQIFLQQFLVYGRQLTPDELDLVTYDPSFIKESPPTMAQFKEQIDVFGDLYVEVENFTPTKVFHNWFRVDIGPFKQALLNTIRKWGNMFKQHLVDHVTNSLTELSDFITAADENLLQPVAEGDYDTLVAIMNYLRQVKERVAAADDPFEPLKETINLLKSYDQELPEEVYVLLQTLPEKWLNTKKIAIAVKGQVAPLQAIEVGHIRKRIMSFDLRQQKLREVFRKSDIFKFGCPNPYRQLDRIQNLILSYENEMNKIMESASLFEVVVPEFKQLFQCRKEIVLLKQLWDFVGIVEACVDDWKTTPWKKIDVESMDIECKKFGKEIRGFDKEIKSWDLYLNLDALVKNMLTSLRAVAELQNPAIRDRHWAQLMEATKVNFVMDKSTTLADLLALNLHNYEEEVKTIVDKSVKEMSMEKVLKDLESTWGKMNFEHEKHERTGCTMLKANEDLIEILEENQVQLQNLLGSKFIAYFLEEVSAWQEKLSNADQVITIWFEVQRTWSHLESIFIGSEDIRKQLPEDSVRFDKVDKEFKVLMAEMAKTPNVIQATNKPKLFDQLEAIQKNLVICEKALAQYLETKRLAFPRFYFVSSADLLDILSNGNKPELVARHLTKLFDSLGKLKLRPDGSGKSSKNARGMFAKDGEYVEFNSDCECTGPVETWLARLEKVMRENMRHYFREAVITYEEKPREQWVFDYPAQVSLCGTQIWWTTEVNIAFSRLEEGYENAIKDYLRKQIQQLSVLITLLLGDLTKHQRQNIMTICTIDVHSRDVVSKLLAAKVDSSYAFQWQSQLRHRWDDKLDDCFGNICDAEFRYAYEYLGCTPRLVITPLTDRCYITLTQSLHLIMGGAPAGPAGTGKTETTKDLGRALGMMVYVFNCSEQMDYRSCGNIYKGLAQTGAWGCFDEFNRISVEVLSVVAVQVKCIQDAIRDKKKIFNFLGEVIGLIPSVGLFITMNPGYAGRTELPENLKALFRPCAMVVPDFELICEIMLVAEGFQEARLLARKFITLYTLCKELLSKQDHYDWGLRAIKSVLVVAGSLKRGDRGRPEDQVLMRALRDFNIPKIVTEDMPVFMGLIGDLFPALDVPRKRDLEFEAKVKQATLDLHLQPEENFILKIVQLEELLEVRHSVFIVGNAGTGKTKVWKSLYRTYQNMKRKPYYNDLNPKAVTNDELFGIINPATREWKDGLVAVMMRDQANMSGDGPRWIVLDGDIDPMWIESLNTVMDDNKVLTLASNERIALTPSMRLLFEIASLRTATPATVSRAGILYINPQDLGWNPFVASWIETRELQTEKANLVILFDKYVPLCLDMIRSGKLKKVTPVTEISHIQTLCHLLDCLLIPQNTPADSPKEWYEIYFVFACVWAFGAATYQDQLVDYRVEFSKWWVNEFKAVKFPSQGTVFGYYIDRETKKFLPWTDMVSHFELDPDLPLQATLVPTSETTCYTFFMNMLMARKHPIMLVGGAGCGKSVIVNEKLASLSENYLVTNIPFNFYTTSEMLQKMLEKPLEKKAGRNFGPPGSKTMVYFIDDMNMPEVDTYGTVQPHTLIRQHLDYGHWYDRAKLTLKDIHNVQYVSCMNPTAGSFTINPRLQRHFIIFALSFPGQQAVGHIYTSILQQHLSFPLLKIPAAVQRYAEKIVAATLSLHQKVAQAFLPTATKFHYIFNLRDLSNIFSGMLFSSGECIPTVVDLVRLWMHESQRIYSDKLVEEKDVDTFQKLVKDVVKKNFEDVEDTIWNKPNLFCHFAQGIGESKYMPLHSWESLHKLLEGAMSTYNDLIGAMNLVLFEDAMMHICRISRILESPRGNALLVGVGGSGKQSLSRLSASISGLDVFQFQIRKGYSMNDLKEDLAGLYLKVGLKGLGTMFLMTDSQVADERFLVVVNDMLASGEVADLFGDDDTDNIINGIRNEVKAFGLADTRENCWKFFIDRVRRQMKIVLCFSPVGSTLRIRARKFPAIVNGTVIDWFHEWPQEALESVSARFLQEVEVLSPVLIPSISKFMAFVHTSVNEMSKSYLANERRYNYTTPKSFLEMINLYSYMITMETKANLGRIDRLQTGLEKLFVTASQVDDLKETLAVQEKEVNKKNEAADELIKVVKTESEKVSAEKAFANEEEERVATISEEVAKRFKECEVDLEKAEPALIAAQEALNTLNKANLTELKSFGSPPAAVTNVTAAVLVLFSPKGNVPKDRSWKQAKLMMGKVDAFLESLIHYNKEDIHPNIVKEIQPYLKDKEFDPEFIRGKSLAAAGLCAWVINIVKFYEVYKYVEPKKQALEKSTAELEEVKKKLEEIKDKVRVLVEQLNVLNAEFEEALAEKQKCQDEADATNKTIDLANRLVNGLASENVRWGQSVQNLKKQGSTLAGDILLVSSFISYVGCFTKRYRVELLEKYWTPTLKKMQPPIPVTEGLDPLSMLTDDAQIAQWNNEGLPSDRMSSENATILTKSQRWPLMIDPQLQGVKWIKTKYGNDLNVVRFGHKGYLDVIENALSEGRVVLIENIGETIEPVLNPLLGRELIKKGRAIRIGDKEVDYNPKFRLILHTKLANPHYKPEIQAQTTLINFTVTRDGLEDQLLAEVVKAERPDLETLKTELTKKQNDFKIQIKMLEDDLLQRLSSAGEDILSDEALVLNLEKTKKTAAEVEEQVEKAITTSAAIDHNRELYRPAAARASLLYFVLNDLHKINLIYQFSLKAFSVVFDVAIERSPPSSEVEARVKTLIDCITHSVYIYTTRGLFERDKLIFTSQMVIQILISHKEVDMLELDFLLRYPVTQNVTSPVDFLSNMSWGGIKTLATMDEFKNLDKDIESSGKRWKKVVESECPEREKFPQEWKNKSALQRLCMMRALRPDRMTYAMSVFIEEKLGTKYVRGESIPFAKSYEETSPSTPVFFILSPGVDPLKDVEALGKKLGFTFDNNNFHNVSLGQGQEVVAEEAMDIAAVEGHWVILQNIHLVSSWLSSLEKKLEQHSENAHHSYRVYMSAEPASSPESHIIPQGILEMSIKITNEPPTGMMANLHKALNSFDQETLEMCSKEAEFKVILFSLCYFHAVVAERRKFGAQGWNRSYPFNLGDLTICVNVLFNYLEASTKVPWEDLRYLFGEIMYGGHITDDWDRRLCKTYLEEYLRPELMDSDVAYAPGFFAPPNTDYVGYHSYIDAFLPPESPNLYGLHTNAEIGFLTTTSENLFRTVFEMQPRDSGGTGAATITHEEKVKQVLEDFMDKLPSQFNMQDIMGRAEEKTPYVIVAFQECERMNMLTEEMGRSLKELSLGLKGELTITSKMEELDEALFLDLVPQEWANRAYPSMLTLGAWFADLLLRVHELEAWVGDFLLPSTVWLAGFFNPQSFLTAIMQSTARKNELPLDKMCLQCDVTKKSKEDISGPPREGAYIQGLFMEGARWDIQVGSIMDSRLKDLFPVMPVVYLRAITQDKQDIKNVYECPVYKTRIRGPTYVWTFNLKTKVKASKWTLAGVAILLQI